MGDEDKTTQTTNKTVKEKTENPEVLFEPSQDESEIFSVDKKKGSQVSIDQECDPSKYDDSFQYKTPPKAAVVEKAPLVLPPNVALAIEVLMKVLECGRLGPVSFTNSITPESITSLLDYAKTTFMSQPACVEVNGPINVCGDIHGQFSDLLRIFDKVGFPNRSNYLFLGDYVDRGKHGMETVVFLMCYKIIFPNNFFLLRGNHECPTINRVYGFYDECTRRQKNARLWEAFQDCFSTMPLTALIGDRILCMHGGISNKIFSMDQIRNFNRPMYQPDHSAPETDILWSDPSKSVNEFGPNQRGVSVMFGVGALNKFLYKLNLDLIIRAHQVVQDGYEFFGNRRLVTVFSAPFYCGQFNNAAAVMTIKENLVCSFTKLKPHPKKKVRKWRFLSQ